MIESLNDALNAEKDNNGILVNKLEKSDSEQVVALEERIAELEKANSELVTANEELTINNAELMKKNKQINDKFVKANKNLISVKEQAKELEKAIQEKDAEIKALTDSFVEKESAEDLQKQYEELEQQISEKNAEIENLTVVNNELKQLLDNMPSEEESEVVEEILSEISEEELLEKINTLKKQIEEKDDKLLELNSKFDELTEDDIRNPEFTRAILAIRERKQELVNKMTADKEAFETQKDRNKALLDEAYRKYYEVKEKREELNKQYQNVGDSTSLRREEYLAKSQKITIEDETIVRYINDRKNDDILASEKFNNAINESEMMIKELNRQEVEIIEFYLNKLKEEYSNNEDYKEYEMQKKDLMKQLNELNIIHLQMQVALEQSRSLVRASKDETGAILETEYSPENDVLILKADISHLEKEYNRLTKKIEMIKVHLENRSKSEKILRITDEDIVKYNTIVTDMDALTVRYQTNDEVIVILKQDLETLNSQLIVSEDSELTEEQLAQNAETLAKIEELNSKLEYVEIVQSNIKEKINYCKEEKESLEENDKVTYYISLLKSMEQLKVKNIEFRVRVNSIQENIDNKKAQLEALEKISDDINDED